jgi:hypothetical protein
VELMLALEGEVANGMAMEGELEMELMVWRGWWSEVVLKMR